MRAREADYASAVAATARLAGRPNYPLAAFLPVSPFLLLLFLFSRDARALVLSLSVFPTLASSLLLRPLPLLLVAFRPSRVESSRVEPLLPFLAGSPPTPSSLSRSDRRISRQDFRFSTRHLLLTLFPPPFLEEEEKIELNDSFLPSFPPFSSIESKI